MKADIEAGAEDRNEDVGMMEPMVISEGAFRRTELVDLAVELAKKATALRSAMPPMIAMELARLVRAMNCYYSNLIEGHDTHPVDIERALKGDYSADPEKRNLQLEAEVHIAVQAWIDEGGFRRRF
ncbi:hypothetical protein ACFQ4K_07105 [Tistrella bauzanensis]